MYVFISMKIYNPNALIWLIIKALKKTNMYIYTHIQIDVILTLLKKNELKEKLNYVIIEITELLLFFFFYSTLRLFYVISFMVY